MGRLMASMCNFLTPPGWRIRLPMRQVRCANVVLDILEHRYDRSEVDPGLLTI